LNENPKRAIALFPAKWGYFSNIYHSMVKAIEASFCRSTRSRSLACHPLFEAATVQWIFGVTPFCNLQRDDTEHQRSTHEKNPCQASNPITITLIQIKEAKTLS
jgi:hypothetical protein